MTMNYREMFDSIENTISIDNEIKEDAEKRSLDVLQYLTESGVVFNETTTMGLLNHLMAMFQRISKDEKIPDLGEDVLDQIDSKAVEYAKEALKSIEEDKNIVLDVAEIALVAIHVQNAIETNNDNKEVKTMAKPVVVIGDRMGKGQHVADGVVKAGGEAYTIPGMAADMKLGDVMKEKNADIGISFCGSGGAGALNAQNKHGYSCRYGMRSIEEGEKAIADGIEALGFGFMDKEELGERIVKAWLKKNS